MKQRIWELDALRGICILGMVVLHFIYDLVDLFCLISWDYPRIVSLAMNWGSIFFILLSGICVTLGRSPLRRGMLVLGAGFLVSIATYVVYALGFSEKDILIYFGILHCLGCCMLLWPLFHRLHLPILTLLSIFLLALGNRIQDLPPVKVFYLMPLGIPWVGFSSADYFPLLPSFGWFLLGTTIGRTLYRKKSTQLPMLNPRNRIFLFLQACGRHSLWIYLLHQPIITGILLLTTILFDP